MKGRAAEELDFECYFKPPKRLRESNRACIFDCSKQKHSYLKRSILQQTVFENELTNTLSEVLSTTTTKFQEQLLQEFLTVDFMFFRTRHNSRSKHFIVG